MPDIYRSRVSFLGGIAGAGVSTMYWTLADPTQKQDIATLLSTFWTALRGRMYSGLTMTLEPTLEVVDDATGRLETEEPITGWTTTGNDTAEPLPWATQGLCRFRTGITTGVPAKEIRGRCFVPGPTEGQSSAGKPISLYTQTLNDAIAALIAGTANAKLCIYSPKNATSALVTSGSAWGDWASLRSRRD